MLRRIVSGGQTGVDISAVIVAKKFGIETGGWMPKGFLTQVGPRPDYAEVYGMQEHSSPSYVPRTYANVKDSDGTLRFAGDFESPGELCTFKAITQYNKPFFDVALTDGPWESIANCILDWLASNEIEVLNVAGNSEKTFPGISAEAMDLMEAIFNTMGLTQGGT